MPIFVFNTQSAQQCLVRPFITIIRVIKYRYLYASIARWTLPFDFGVRSGWSRNSRFRVSFCS